MSKDSRNENDRATDGPPLLRVDQLAVEFTNDGISTRVVNGVSFEIRRGETVALVGESGSGKSTIGLAVMGLLPVGTGKIVNGTVTFDGIDLRRQSEADLRRIRGARMSMVFQDPLSALNPVLTIGHQVAEMFTEHRKMSRSAARGEVIELLKRVRMPDADSRFKQYPQQFSGGMRQRVVIAMALALDPELIIADEPTTALDVTVQDQIMDLLDDLTDAQGSGLLLITHDLAVVADRADRIYVLYAGRVMESGPIRKIYDAPGHPYTKGLLASVPTVANVDGALTPIPGNPPDPSHVAAGCPFEPRCRYARDRCRAVEPELRQVAPGRFSACHYAEEVIADDNDRTELSVARSS